MTHPRGYTSYVHIGQHDFDPFNPTPLDALKEALAFIQSPQVSTAEGGLQYRCSVQRFSTLTAMMRHAIALAERVPA